MAQWSSGSAYAPASIAVSWPSQPAAGDVLVVAFWNNGQSSGAANTYTAPAGWSSADLNTSHAFATYQVFTHVAAAGDASSYTFTPQAAQREQAWIAADVSNASGVDVSGDAYVNSSAAYVTPGVTPSQTGDIALAFNLPMTLSSVTWSNSAAWTAGTVSAPWPGESVYQTLSTAAQTSESATLSAAASGFAGIVLLSAAAAQPSPTPSPTSSPAPSPSPSPVPTSGGGSAPLPQQWSSGAAYAPSSIAVSFPAAPAAGDVLIVAFWNNGQSTGAANTYTAPAGWTAIGQDTSHAYATFEAFSHVAASGESGSYTFAPQAAQREHAWITVDAGKASGVDKSADAYVNNSASYVTPSLSPSQSGELALAFQEPMALSSVTWSNAASWTLGTGPSPTWHGEAVYEAPAGGAVSESSTLSAAASGFSALVLVGGSAATPTPAPTSTPAPIDWSTMGFDNERTGYNPNERVIGTGSFGSFHALWSSPPSVGYQMVGEPVLAANVSVGGVSRTLLYAGGQSGLFYAIDADTGAVVWQKQLGAGSYTCPGSGSSSAFGIEGAGAIDRSRNRVYVPDGVNQVHALDLATGAEAAGWPASIAPSTGHDFIYAGLTFNPNNGVLYAETSSTCDISPWYGRISAINTATGAVTATFYPTQGTSGGGIWGFGGASVDPATNDVFVATGNADGAVQNAYYAEQIVELTPDLSSVIAANYPNIPTASDSDFGATPLLFQPPGCPPLLAAVNKSGAFVLYDRNDISAGPTQLILMSVANSTGSFIGVPSYDPVTNDVYVGLPSTFGIYRPGAGAFSVTSSCTLNPTPVWNAVFGPDVAGTGNDGPRSPITIANGVAYVSGYTDDTTYAFDAATGAKLWSAPLSGIGIVGPIVVNGKLYVGDYGGTIHAWAP